jgi:hypothetical protein
MCLEFCECCPAPLQLLQHGYFPSAPLQPTVAIKLNMLEFLNELFLRIPPNLTGWSEALHVLLERRGHAAGSTVSPYFPRLISSMNYY